MAIYKPSNLSPNLEEINAQSSKVPFTAEIHAQGEAARGYKIEIFDDKGTTSLYKQERIDLQAPVKNGQTLKSDLDLSEIEEIQNGKDYQWNLRVYSNKKRYEQQDGSFIYRKEPKPLTKICNGYLAGSTRYVIWDLISRSDPHWSEKGTEAAKEKYRESLKNLIKYDRYIEIKTTGPSQIMPILPPNTENIQLPASGEEYIERQKIDWVTADLGNPYSPNKKNILKIETVEPFKYNYKDETEYNVYLCDNKYTYNSIFVDPYDEIQPSYWIIIYEDATELKRAYENYYTNCSSTGKDYVEESFVDSSVTAGGMTPALTSGFARHKIFGYSSDTGEVRFEDQFTDGDGVPRLPVTEQRYLLLMQFTNADSEETKLYKLINYDAVVDDEVVEEKYVLGGWPVYTGKIFTNNIAASSSQTTQLFIQANVNIKTDENNPTELFFPDNSSRVGIITKTVTITDAFGNETEKDITIDELDGSQWLLTSLVQPNTPSTPIIPSIPEPIPKRNYTVYSDFMDSQPMSYFYARQPATIALYYKNQQGIEDYRIMPDNISDAELDAHTTDWLNISFRGTWNSSDNVLVKYYFYKLYAYGETNFDEIGDDLLDEEYLIKTSDTFYSVDVGYPLSGWNNGDRILMDWGYKGFLGLSNDSKLYSEKLHYCIQLSVVDQYGELSQKEAYFAIKYTSQNANIPLYISNGSDWDACSERAMFIDTSVPTDALSGEEAASASAEINNEKYNGDFINIYEYKDWNSDIEGEAEDGKELLLDPHDTSSKKESVSSKQFLDLHGNYTTQEHTILNYAYIENSNYESTPFNLKLNEFSFLTQVRLKKDFLKRIIINYDKIINEPNSQDNFLNNSILQFRVSNKDDDDVKYRYTLKINPAVAYLSNPALQEHYFFSCPNAYKFVLVEEKEKSGEIVATNVYYQDYKNIFNFSETGKLSYSLIKSNNIQIVDGIFPVLAEEDVGKMFFFRVALIHEGEIYKGLWKAAKDRDRIVLLPESQSDIYIFCDNALDVNGDQIIWAETDLIYRGPTIYKKTYEDILWTALSFTPELKDQHLKNPKIYYYFQPDGPEINADTANIGTESDDLLVLKDGDLLWKDTSGDKTFMWIDNDSTEEDNKLKLWQLYADNIEKMKDVPLSFFISRDASGTIKWSVKKGEQENE